MNIKIVLAGILAFVFISFFTAMSLETLPIQNDLTEEWTNKWQIVGWTALIVFITLAIPLLPFIKGGAVFFEVLGGMVAWMLA